MKKILTIIQALLVLTTMNNRISAQDVRLTKTKIADILMQMPAKNSDHLNGLMIQTIRLGDEAFTEMSNMLKAPGEGDDVAVRYAFTSLARYTSQKDHEKEWEWLQNNFLKAIQTATHKEVQSYLIEQLNYGANDKCVGMLAKYLNDERLCEPVTQLFLSIRTGIAEKALVDALPSATGKNQVTLVKALGVLHSEAALPALTKLAGSADNVLQRTVLSALANIGAAGSYDLLWNAAGNSGFYYEPTEATASFLVYCDKLGSNHELKLCKQACLAICKHSQGNLLHNQAAALKIFSRYFKAEAMPLLLKAVNNPDSSFRMAVLNIAGSMPDPGFTAKWIKSAGKASAPVKADILYMLGQRGDKTAVPFVKGNLQDKSAEVRRQASWALVKLDEQVAIAELLKQLSKGTDVEIAEKALGTLLDEKKLDNIAAELTKAANAGKPGLINLIASKSGKRFFNVIFPYTSGTDAAIKSAAISALPRIGSYSNIEQMIQLLSVTENPQDIAQIQTAIVNAVREKENPEVSIIPVLASMSQSSQKEKLIPVLPLIGGTKALETVAGLYEKSEGAQKTACVTALVNWTSPDASNYLYGICKNDPQYGSDAFKGFVQQVKDAKWFDDQKLLKLQMIMPLARNKEERRLVLSALSNVRTFLSLVYLGKYLDDADLQQVAAQSAVLVALPESGKKNGFYGDIPRDILKKVIRVIEGPESDYNKENIRRYLEMMPNEQGFVSMFNGTDLGGWKGYITDPVKLAALTETERAAKQSEANLKMLANWSVKNEMIVFNGEGNNLLSDKEYGDFELFVNWRIRKKGDSGIYLRGTPQVQIWDTSRVEVGAQVGSGGLYNNQSHPSKPLKVADNPIDDWNTFHIYMIGEKVTVYLNGELVVDNIPLENYWDRKLPIFPKGTIELQAHGTDLAFKDIYVREIRNTEAAVSPQEKAEGFESLFNGKNLDGWVGDKVNYKAKDGLIVIEPSAGAGGGNLYTESEFGDFNFRFEFQLTPGANNGLGIRAPLEGDAAYVGMELQILDNEAPVYADLKPYQYHGSVYGVIPAKRGFLKPTGEWNTEEVVVKGKKVKVILNGSVILDGDIEEASRNGTMDHNQHPGLLRDKGHIGFLGHGSVVKFRNIRVKPL